MKIPMQSFQMDTAVGLDGHTSLGRYVANEAQIAAFDGALGSSEVEMQSAMLKIKLSVLDGNSS